VAYGLAVLNGTAPRAIHPSSPTRINHRRIEAILLRNIDRPWEKVKVRIFEEIFTAEQINAALRDKRRLHDDISPRLYIKRLKAHNFTRDGTSWMLVDTAEPLESNVKELHVVLRAESYTLVLLGHPWSWKRDTTHVLDCDIARSYLQGIELKRFDGDAVVDENDWPKETDHFLCNVYGRRESLRGARTAVRSIAGRMRIIESRQRSPSESQSQEPL